MVRSQEVKIHGRNHPAQETCSRARRYFNHHLGNFAIWAGLFSATDCALIGLRKKEDSYNQIAAGAVTGGLLAFRSGARVAMKNAVFGGMMLGCIVIVEKVMMKLHKREELQMQKDMTEKHNREQRRMIAKARPDLF